MGPILAPDWKIGSPLAFHICRMSRKRSRKIGWKHAGWQAFLNGKWFIGGRTKKIVKECVREWTYNVFTRVAKSLNVQDLGR